MMNDYFSSYAAAAVVGGSAANPCLPPPPYQPPTQPVLCQENHHPHNPAILADANTTQFNPRVVQCSNQLVYQNNGIPIDYIHQGQVNQEQQYVYVNNVQTVPNATNNVVDNNQSQYK